MSALLAAGPRAWAPTRQPRASARSSPPLPGARRRLAAPCRASSGDQEAGAGPQARSLSEAYAVLGLAEGTPYDEVLAVKNKLLEGAGGDMERRMEVEAAYDLIFSSQLRARLTGDLPVATNVRFADVQRRRAAPPPPPAAQKAQQLLGGLGGRLGGLGGGGGGVAVAPPSQRTAATAGAIYGLLAAWTLAQGLLEPTPTSAAADVPGLQLALATAATVYLLREEKRAGLGKAVGLALGGLVLGTLLGSAVQGWLRVDIIPLGGLSSPGTLVGEFSIAGLALTALFLA